MPLNEHDIEAQARARRTTVALAAADAWYHHGSNLFEAWARDAERVDVDVSLASIFAWRCSGCGWWCRSSHPSCPICGESRWRR